MPFAAGDSVGGGDQINHFGAVKIRVVGTGILRPKLYALDNAFTVTLATITMASSPGKTPVVLTNLVSQRARLELKTTTINEKAKINRIVLYVKPIYTGYPQ